MNDWDVRIYNSSGERVTLPENWVTEARFEIIERGGFGNGSLDVGATWEDLSLVGTERADVYLYGNLAYRGWIRLPQAEATAPEKWVLSLFGMITTLDKWIVKRRFAYSEDTDLSLIFTDLIESVAMTSGRYPNLIIDSEPIGVTAVTFDAYGKSLAQAINQLCDLAPNMCVWGADVDSYNRDRIYFRSRNLNATQTYAIGGDVAAFIYPQDANAVVNRVILKGGATAYPNIAHNGSFENPEPNSYLNGNLIWEPSFEDVSILNQHWVFSATASTKQSSPGDTTAMGAAHSGSVWVELDTPGEYVYQIMAVDYTQPMMATMWARREGTVPGAIAIHVDGLDASGNVIKSYDSGYQDPGGDAYVQYFLPIDFTAYSNVTQAKFWAIGNSGTANNDGNLVDDVGLYEINGCAQTGWDWDVAGNAKKGALNLACTDYPAVHGGLCAMIEASNVSVSGDWLELANTLADAAGVHEQTYTLLLYWRTNGATATFSFGVYEIRTDNSQTTVNESQIITASATSWQMAKMQWIPKSDCVKARIFIRNRSNAALYLDAIALLEGDIPYDMNANECYWEGSDFEATADVTDARLIHLNSSVKNSIATFGDREAYVTDSDVIDWTEAELYISSYLNAHAYPEVKGRMTLILGGGSEVPNNSGSIRLVGLPNEPQPLYPSRIAFTVSADARVDVDLGNERPDLALLLRYLNSENNPQNSSSSGGGGVTSINGQSGGVWVPGLVLSASTPQPVASVGAIGVSPAASPGDHAHEGVHSVNGMTGDVTVSGGGTLYTSVPNPIAATGAVGVATAASPGDHVHEGVHSVNGLKGDVTLPASLANPMTTQGDIIIAGSGGTPVRLALGSAGQALVAGASAPEWANIAGGGGSILYGGYAALPAAGTVGRLYLAIDAMEMFYDNGSAWVPFGPIYELTAPPQTLSWINQGSATVSYPNGVAVLSSYTPLNGSDDVAALVKTYATPYKVTVRLKPVFAPLETNLNYGIVIADNQSIDTKMVCLALKRDGSQTGGTTLQVRYLSSPTSWNSSPFQVDPGEIPEFMRFYDDGTNFYWSVSGDGVNFYNVWSAARTAWLGAPYSVGWYVNPHNQTYPAQVSLTSWTEG